MLSSAIVKLNNCCENNNSETKSGFFIVYLGNIFAFYRFTLDLGPLFMILVYILILNLDKATELNTVTEELTGGNKWSVRSTSGCG